MCNYYEEGCKIDIIKFRYSSTIPYDDLDSFSQSSTPILFHVKVQLLYSYNQAKSPCSYRPIIYACSILPRLQWVAEVLVVQLPTCK
jgi:hypothetical protein